MDVISNVPYVWVSIFLFLFANGTSSLDGFMFSSCHDDGCALPQKKAGNVT